MVHCITAHKEVTTVYPPRTAGEGALYLIFFLQNSLKEPLEYSSIDRSEYTYLRGPDAEQKN